MKYYLLFYSLIFLFIFCSCYDESLNFDHDIIQKDLDSNYTFIMNEADALDLVSRFELGVVVLFICQAYKDKIVDMYVVCSRCGV